MQPLCGEKPLYENPRNPQCQCCAADAPLTQAVPPQCFSASNIEIGGLGVCGTLARVQVMDWFDCRLGFL